MKSLNTALQAAQLPADLISLINTIANTTSQIAETVSCGALGKALGETVEENVQGEVQKNLDVIANDLLKNALLSQGSVRALASEEEPVTLVATAGAPYLVAFDPLDGSSNVDVNAQIGTIFTILKARDDVLDASEEQFYQQGHQQLCAGYVLYGPYTTLLITLGQQTYEFTLQKNTGEFIATQENVQLPAGTPEFSINMANLFYWSEPLQHYIFGLIAKKPTGPRFNMRWQGAMVGDVHRVLSRGGLFIYPSDNRDEKQPAKLRLLYEAFPMALLIEAAGGLGFTETGRILDQTLTQLHQRTPVILGDSQLVTDCFNALSNVKE